MLTEDTDDLKSQASYMAIAQRIQWDNIWHHDTGTTNHICKVKAMFATLRPWHAMIKGVNDEAPSLDVEGVGDIHL
jgi:hypothetical protein